MSFVKKCFLCCIVMLYYIITKFYCLIAFTSLRYWAIAYYPICTVMNFVISWTKSQDKNWNTIGTKRALRWKKKNFHHFQRTFIFKRHKLPQTWDCAFHPFLVDVPILSALKTLQKTKGFLMYSGSMKWER